MALAGTTAEGAAVTAATVAGGIVGGPVGAILGGAEASFISRFFHGCGQKCILSSNFVNQAEPLLQKNVAAYMSGGHTEAEKEQALSIFDQIWQQVTTYCGELGDKNCTGDRQAGACKWKDASGNCWNWFSGYRDPIANDKTVAATPNSNIATDIVQGSSAVGQILGLPGGGVSIAGKEVGWGTILALAGIAAFAIGEMRR